jgi:hypothetical protein
MAEEFDPQELIQEYEDYLIDTFERLWSEIKVEPDKLEAYSVIGALLSRQVTLSIELARSPRVWNGHSAPLYLRAMTDLYIALAWILGDLSERAKMYIMHGLGEEKLLLEIYKQEVAERKARGENVGEIEQIVEGKEAWINFQRREFFVEVNLGNWAPLNYRDMAIEAGCESLYKFAYKPFSQAAHNMWPHVSVYNSRTCENPLHRNHLVPALLEVPLDPDYLYRSVKYVDKTYALLVRHFGLAPDWPMPHDWWDSYFEKNASVKGDGASPDRPPATGAEQQ